MPTEPGDSAAAQAENRVQWGLLEELRAPPSNAVIAWRDRVRWMRHFAPHRAKASGRKVQPRDRGVYLITGGFGGIAGAVSEWLARDHHARLVLLARTPLPPREEWDRWLREHERDEAIAQSIQRVRDLEAFGAEVLPVAADVTVAEQLEDALALVKERFGAINGVFHAAGVLRDNLIALKSERDIEDVFSAKLYGTLVLDAALQSMPLDFMVLFSSVSSYVAPVGQIDYVAANAFLNAFAESCRDRRKYPVLAINWGIWKGIGMVATPHS
ncbi:SDR family NAD(P)-dependent oxidoreductase, partial [bacterium]